MFSGVRITWAHSDVNRRRGLTSRILVKRQRLLTIIDDISLGAAPAGVEH